MRICHISDTHIGSSSHFNVEIFNAFMDDIRQDDFDILLHSGDLTQSGSAEQYEKGKHFLKELKIPYVIIPGNHDARSGGLHLYKQHIGNPNGTKVLDEAVIIYVDSSIPDSNNGRVGQQKFQLIKKSLEKYTQKKIKIVVIHHHVMPIPMAGRERNILANAGDLLDLFLKYDVDLVVSGHRHYPNVYHVENTVFINAGTFSCTKTRYGDENSYNIIEISKNKQKVITRRPKTTVKNEFPRFERRIFSDFGKHIKRIAHMSNTFISDSRAFRKKHLTSALESIRKLNPDHIIHCGGVVQEGIERNYELALRYFGDLKQKMFFTPAGRDLNYLGYHLFPEYCGELDYIYEDEKLIMHGINSSQYDSNIGFVGSIARNQLITKFLKKKNKLKVLFLHHNLTPIPRSREKGLLEDSGDLLRELVDANIDLVLTGTSSHPFSVKVSNTLIINANSTSSIYQRSILGNSFNLIDVYEKAIILYEINSLWGTRKLKGIWERNKKN